MEDAESKLIGLIENGDYVTQNQAINALSMSGLKKAVPWLTKSLDSRDVFVRRSSMLSLISLNEDIHKVDFISFLNDDDHEIRWKVAEELAKLGYLESVPCLVEMFDQSEHLQGSWEIRSRAIAGFKSLDLKEIIFVLVDSFELNKDYSKAFIGRNFLQYWVPVLLEAYDGDLEIREKVSYLLNKLDSENFILGLLNSIDHSKPEVRDRAIKALKEREKRNRGQVLAAIPKLESQSKTRLVYRLLEEFPKEVGLMAFQIPDHSTVPNFDQIDIEKLCLSSKIVGNKIFKDRFIASQETLDFLCCSANSKDLKVLEGLIDVCSVISPEQSTPILLKVLKNKNINVSTSLKVILLLGSMGNKEAIPELTKKLRSKNYFARKTSAESLAFGNFKKEDLYMVLPFFKMLLPTGLGMLSFDAARPIQVKCQFYDYKIWQQLIQSTKSEIQNGEATDRSGTQQNFYGPVYGVAGNVEGNQIISSPTTDSTQSSANPIE